MATLTIHRSQVLELVLLAFIAGTVAGSVINPHALRIFLYGGGILVIALSTVFLKPKTLMLAAATIGAFALGVWRLEAVQPLINEDHIASYNDKGRLEWEGVVVAEPDVRRDKINYTIRAERVLGPAEQPVSGLVLVSGSLYPEYGYGDRLRVVGKLTTPFETKDFSYKKYLAQRGIYSTLRATKLERLAAAQGNPIVRALLHVKSAFIRALSGVLPEPHNGLLAGLLVGARRALPEHLLEAFRITGVTHIIAISGFNISIITRMLGAMIQQRFGPRIALVVSGVVVAGFVVITGAAASVVRAAIMGLLAVVGLTMGRINAAFHALLVAAGVMVAISPAIAYSDIGFQLSFLATAGLIFFSDALERAWSWMPNIFELRTALVSTLSAQLFVLPLLIFYFDRLSLISPLVNVLILPIIPLTMLLGFLTGVAALISLPLALLPGWLTWGFLHYEITVIEFFAKVPFAALDVPGLPLPWVLSYYVFLLLTVVVIRSRRREQMRTIFGR